MVMVGFHKNIERRISSLLGDIIVSPLYDDGDFDTFHASKLKQKLETILSKELNRVNCVTQQYVLLQSEKIVEGAALYGVQSDSETAIQQYILCGRMPIPKKASGDKEEILLSQNIANKLNVQLGAKILLCTPGDSSSIEEFRVVGIYNTHLPDFDEKFAFCDESVMREVFNCKDKWATSVNCFLKNSKSAARIEQIIEECAGDTLYTRSIKEEYSDIFEWIGILYKNTVIFLIILLVVINTNIASIASIQLIERRYIINVFSTLGATHWQLVKIFILKNLSMIGKGVIYGNLIGLGICAVQNFLKLVKLDSNFHYTEDLPIEWDWRIVIGVNGITCGIIFLLVIANYFYVLKTKTYSQGTSKP